MTERSQDEIVRWNYSETLRLAQQLERELRRFIIEFEKRTGGLTTKQVQEFTKTLDKKHTSLGPLLIQLQKRVSGSRSCCSQWCQCRLARNELAHRFLLRINDAATDLDYQKIEKRLWNFRLLFVSAIADVQEFRKYCRPPNKSHEKRLRKQIGHLLRRQVPHRAS